MLTCSVAYVPKVHAWVHGSRLHKFRLHYLLRQNPADPNSSVVTREEVKEGQLNKENEQQGNGPKLDN